MTITEVRIKLARGGDSHLLAFASITFDNAFVVRDLKLILGQGRRFAAMPSRKLTDHCPRCGWKNVLDQRYCGGCCKLLGETRATRDEQGRQKIHSDIAHPINGTMREEIETAMCRAYEAELVLAQLDGYVCSYDRPYPEHMFTTDMPSDVHEEHTSVA